MVEQYVPDPHHSGYHSGYHNYFGYNHNHYNLYEVDLFAGYKEWVGKILWEASLQAKRNIECVRKRIHGRNSDIN